MTSLLIDADITLYRAASVCEREVRWDEVNHVLVSNAEEVWQAVTSQIEMYRKELSTEGEPAPSLHFALTGPNNFRRDLWDDYKGGRSRKPLCYGAVRQRLIDTYDARSVDGLEADDLLGIWATQGRIKDPIIVSLDKDLRTIPARVWRPAANSEQKHELFTVTEDQADYFWMTQVLTGDVTDGYKGLPGCGPKVAEKLLTIGAPLADLWSAVVAAYEAKGLTVEDALLQARLARILRASDWDGVNKKIKLWEAAV